MKFIQLLIFSIFLPVTLFSQNITGKVTGNKLPLPYANIAIEGTYYGTISNSKGVFNLVIPEKHKDKAILVSHLGYQTDTVKQVKGKTFYHIQLLASDYSIGEVSVFPKDTILAYLKEAIRKIPDNYLNVDSRQTGFYRESLESKGKHLYFGEAILDVYKSSYEKKGTGSIKILRSRINKTTGTDSIPFIHFYGGIYWPHYGDMVKERDAFLNPSKFDSYMYHIDTVMSQGEKVFWKIVFSPKLGRKARYKGHLIMDFGSKAITELNFKYTETGKKLRTRNLGFESLGREFNVLYHENNGRYYLKYFFDKESLKSRKTGAEYFGIDEYVTTSVDTVNANPIPFSGQDLLSTVFSAKAEDYSNSDWTDYNVLSLDSSVDNPVLVKVSNDESYRLLSEKDNKSSKHRTMQILVDFASRSYMNLYLGAEKVTMDDPIEFIYKPSRNHNFPLLLNSLDGPLYNIGYQMGYRFTNNLGIFLEFASTIKDHYYKSDKLGFRYNFAIKSYGKKSFIMPAIAIGKKDYGVFVGKLKSSNDFKVGNKKINADQISFFIGNSSINSTASVCLKKEFSRSFSLLAEIAYNFPITKTPTLFVKEESGFILTRKIAKQKIEESEEFLFSENSFKNIRNTKLNQLKFKIGIEFGR